MDPVAMGKPADPFGVAPHGPARLVFGQGLVVLGPVVGDLDGTEGRIGGLVVQLHPQETGSRAVVLARVAGAEDVPELDAGNIRLADRTLKVLVLKSR